MVIIRAESREMIRPTTFLRGVKKLLQKSSERRIQISEPIPALMAQRSGRYRSLLVIRLTKKSYINAVITPAIQDIEILARKIKLRWTIDVDPHETL
jgi:primosomal protein N' (replication factor Y)